MIQSQLALAEAHLQMTRWFEGDRIGDQPPLSREEALRKALSYATQAKELAEEKGMKGYVKKADELLAEIGEIVRKA